MTPVVYLDVLFLINFSVNYLLLYITGKVLFVNTKKWRMLLAAAFGGVYSCFIFFPELSGFYTFSSKAAFSFMITYQAFGIRKIKLFLKTVAVFYISSFLMCGITLALVFLLKSAKGVESITNNGVFYFNMPWRVLFLGGICLFFIMKITKRLLLSQKGTIYKEIKINFMKKSITLSGFIDTGNRLTDPVCNKPVVVCELKSVEKILPPNMITFFEKNTEELTARELESLNNIRLIPYSSIGRKSGVMAGFLSDSVEVEGRIYEKIIVAVHSGTLSSDEDYNALLGAQFMN